ncbi:MAG TPA: acyclic terpene utilization AtuA family protein, partial [Acidimicrobiales bacterium]
AGHLIECGPQVTGGNYAFVTEVPGLEHPGFPIAEVAEDGSSIITKHPGTGGQVSVGTVTAQLVYEIAGPDYANTDVVARFDTIQLEQLEPDRVRVSGTRGLPAPKDVKVSINLLGGWRNTMTFVLTGLDIEAKAALTLETMERKLGGAEQFAEYDVRLIRSDKANAPTNAEASAQLRITVKDADRSKVGRAFADAGTELALASYPGFHLTSPPTDATSYGVFWPALVPAELVEPVVVRADGSRTPVPHQAFRSDVHGTQPAPRPGTQQTSPAGTAPLQASPAGTAPPLDGPGPYPAEATVPMPLGTLVGARSGDKGGNANVGVWARQDDHYQWLFHYLTVERMALLIPEAAGLEIRRFELPRVRALNFVVVGLLGEGVASSTRPDPQAKSLGEYLRSRLVDVPVSFVPHHG